LIIIKREYLLCPNIMGEQAKNNVRNVILNNIKRFIIAILHPASLNIKNWRYTMCSLHLYQWVSVGFSWFKGSLIQVIHQQLKII